MCLCAGGRAGRERVEPTPKTMNGRALKQTWHRNGTDLCQSQTFRKWLELSLGDTME
jgi:hypothetical protein